MPSTVEGDRRREAEHVCRELPSRPLTRRESERLQADPSYDVYWVRGYHSETGEKLVTQLAVRFDYAHVLGLAYAENADRWEVVATGDWPGDIRAIGGDLDRAASPVTEWHTPLTNSLE